MVILSLITNYPYMYLARSVLSLTKEVEHSSIASVAIFSAWCLVLVHGHACLGACGVVGRGLSIDTVYTLIACHSVQISIDIHCITLLMLSPTTREKYTKSNQLLQIHF